MALTGQDFKIYAGDHLTMNFSLLDSDGVSPLNLTGATIKWAMADDVYATPAVSKTTASGVTITDPVNGKVSVELSPADTTGLEGPFYHEMVVTDAQNEPSTVAIGTVTVYPRLNS